MEATHIVSVIPDFIAHYRHHNEEHHTVSFVDFILEHIMAGEEHHNDREHPEHDHCPVSHNHASVSLLTFLPEDYKVHFDFSAIEADSAKTNIQQQYPLSQYATSIWQPPKIA